VLLYLYISSKIAIYAKTLSTYYRYGHFLGKKTLTPLLNKERGDKA